MSVPQQVLVNFEYNYTARDGSTVSIKPNEHYILVSKTNDAWWQVRRDETAKPFYIPATYVTELLPENSQTPLDPPEEFSGFDFPQLETPDRSESAEILTTIKRDTEKDGHRISTYIIPKELFEPKVSKAKSIQPENELKVYNTERGINHETSSDHSPSSHFMLSPHINTVNAQSDTNTSMNKSNLQVDLKSLDEDLQMFIGSEQRLPDKDSTDIQKSPESPETDKGPAEMMKSSCPATGPASHPAHEVTVEDDNPLTSVYVNIPRLRRNTIDTSPPLVSPPRELVPDPPDTLLLDSAGWEIHTDDQSGQEFYYQPSTGRSTWEYPLSTSMESSVRTEETLPSPPSFSQSPTCSPMGSSPRRLSSDWEKVLDENSGRHYFFNTVSGQSSWDAPEDNDKSDSGDFLKDCPPLPEEDYPSYPAEYSLIHVKKVSIPRGNLDQSSPHGWTLNIDPDGVWVFTNDYTQEQWIKSLDDAGRTYYYTRDGTKSQWNLPENTDDVGPYALGNGAFDELEGTGSMQNWRHSLGHQEEKIHSSSYGQNVSDSESSGSHEISNNVSNLEKAGILNKTKVSENGKKVRKNWAQSWTVLHGGVLTFHKDPKSAPGSASSKTNQIVPEFKVDLKGATIGWATKEKSSKKNVLELKSRSGAEFLIQYDTESIISDWHKVIIDTIRQLDLDQQHSEDEEEMGEKADKEERFLEKRTMSNATRQSVSSSTSEADQKKARTKLMKFLLKRPTLQSVKDKGYIRENVFGCHLHNLCTQEKATVPSFVEKCIRTVEKKGLGIDGLYRVSGNLAVIQKLRFKADHEDLDLDEGNWDIHVITGALKLFFRELQEPLFPYNFFNEFISGIKMADYYKKLSHMKNLVQHLPSSNHDTMEALFRHLRKVIQHGDENRMTVQNVAIVFGPTLLKPEVETANITMYMVFQNQIVEFLLNEFESIFHM
ncbi:rho GTPase-activating protein 27 isoform X2 [Misgurnus anguillicaudatus]|uniref:rho GTPase-activating protein 27 isoform X2 n=1 Tax=Misgurnus anguillicaudatus TaxID=75329 RepID=UPI003CCF4239